MKEEIFQGDCLEVMRGFADKSFDLVLTDPPYNVKNIGPNSRKYEGQIMQLPLREYKKFCRGWFKEALRVGKTVVFTPGIANICYYPQPDWIIAWHKPASVSFNRMGGFNAWEPICVYGKMAKGKRLPQDYLLVNTMNFSEGAEKGHPCPKPLELMSVLLDKFSNAGDSVLDPMCGSGTTGVACKNLGRDFTGIDLIERYCDISRGRLKQQSIFSEQSTS